MRSLMKSVKDAKEARKVHQKAKKLKDATKEETVDPKEHSNGNF